MAGEREMYLITSGEYSDFRVEFAVITAALAKAGVAKVNEAGRGPAEFRAMPVLDYVPERVGVWTYHLMLDRHLGWKLADHEPTSPDPVWDFEAPKLGVSVEIESDPESAYAVQIIRVSHTDQGAARSVAESMLAELRREGPARPVGEVPGYEG